MIDSNDSTNALRVLLVEDDPILNKAIGRILERAGFRSRAVSNLTDARTELASLQYDVLLTDIHLPGGSGVDLLAEAREIDPELPVILVTAAPQLETAVMALNLGAHRYLTKPLDFAELERVVRRAGLIRHFALLKRRAVAAVGAEDGDRLDLDRRLDRSIDGLWMAWQPIVTERGSRLLGFEALMRSDEPSLNRPDEVLGAAQRLDRCHELGRAIRRRVSARASLIPSEATIFLNLLPADLLDPDLADPESILAPIASRIMLELTERATLGSIPGLAARIQRLRSLGFRIAVDDLGAGYSGLTSISQLEPDVVKLDMSLIRGIHESAARRNIVRSMVALCQSMQVTMIAEGIEVPAEAEVLWDLGVDNLQGYLFGRPQREPSWARGQVA